jgi:hypothetical protein
MNYRDSIQNCSFQQQMAEERRDGRGKQRLEFSILSPELSSLHSDMGNQASMASVGSGATFFRVGVSIQGWAA